jgi:hypothetical protein
MPKCRFCGADMIFRDFGPYYPLYDVPGASVGYWECLNFNDGRHGDPRQRQDRYQTNDKTLVPKEKYHAA